MPQKLILPLFGSTFIIPSLLGFSSFHLSSCAFLPLNQYSVLFPIFALFEVSEWSGNTILAAAQIVTLISGSSVWVWQSVCTCVVHSRRKQQGGEIDSVPQRFLVKLNKSKKERHHPAQNPILFLTKEKKNVFTTHTHTHTNEIKTACSDISGRVLCERCNIGNRNGICAGIEIFLFASLTDPVTPKMYFY